MSEGRAESREDLSVPSGQREKAGGMRTVVGNLEVPAQGLVCSTSGKGETLAMFLGKTNRIAIVVGLINQEVSQEEPENKDDLGYRVQFII